MKDDRLYLIHINESIEKIESFIKGGEKEFLKSTLVQDAVIRNFEIIGEAAKHISSKMKEKFPDVPWKRVAGFRDVLIHNYMGVEMEEIWSHIEEHLPTLKKNVLFILAEIDKK